MALPAATRAAAGLGLCRIVAASASSSPSSSSPATPAAAGGGRRERRERELPFALAERGMVVGGHRGMGMNAVGAPPGARVGAARERVNTLLSFGRAAEHVAFVEFDVQVLFLTEGGTSKHHDSRRNSLGDAVRVCLEYDLHGIVSEVRGVLKNPTAFASAQDSNLALLTYGQLNNVWEAVYVQYLMGINGIIVDRVEEISNAVEGFSKTELDRYVVVVEGAMHQAFSQQQLGFLLRLIPELIEQRH
ncbi:unnamed protein product [Urochloa humidicola]